MGPGHCPSHPSTALSNTAGDLDPTACASQPRLKSSTRVFMGPPRTNSPAMGQGGATCHLAIREATAGGLKVQGQPEKLSQALFQNKNRTGWGKGSVGQHPWVRRPGRKKGETTRSGRRGLWGGEAGGSSRSAGPGAQWSEGRTGRGTLHSSPTPGRDKAKPGPKYRCTHAHAGH